MLVAYGPDGHPVIAEETPLEQLQQWSHERALHCPNCRRVVHVRGGPGKRAQLHFAHQKGECAWSTESESVRHIGPTAQDFHAAFAVGEDDQHIATVDADGVALAAIQGLNQKLEEELAHRDAELRSLRQQLTELKTALGKQTTPTKGGPQ